MPWATVFDNVCLPLRLRGVSKAAARERGRWMASPRSAWRISRGAYPRELSGGMQHARLDRPRPGHRARGSC